MSRIVAFSKIPFLYITVFYCVGMLFSSGFYLPVDSIIVILLASLLSLMIFLRFKLNQFYLVSIAFLFIGIGAFTYKMKDVERLGIPDQGAFVLKVQEATKGKKDWNKVIGEIKGYIKNDTLQTANERIVLFVQNEMFEKGDVVLAYLKMNTIKNKNNPGEFNAEMYWRTKGIQKMAFVESWKVKYLDHLEPNFFQSKTDDIRKSIQSTLNASFSKEVSSLISALLLGDKSMLSQDVKSNFSKAGAMHVLAVSGLHVGIVLIILSTFLSWFKRWFSKKSALIISIVLLWIYAAVIGFPLSVVRACFMFTLLSLSVLSNRQNNVLNTLFFSAFVLLLIEPKWIFDIGFQLSYMAMLGIILLHPLLKDAVFIKNKWGKKVWDWSTLSIAAQLFTLPLTLYYFHQFPNYFLISNLGMILFSGVLLALSILFVAVYKIPFLNSIVAIVLAWGISAMIYFVDWVANLPYSTAVGFNLHPLEGFFIILIILFMYSLHKHVRFSLIASLAFLLVLGYVQVKRYNVMEMNEVVLFSSSQRIVAVKENKMIKCFYPNGKRKDATYIMDGYTKVAPGEVEFIEWEEGVYAFDNTIELNHQKKNTIVRVGDIHYNIRSRYDSPKINKGINIEMPFLESSKESKNLGEGAIRIPY